MRTLTLRILQHINTWCLLPGIVLLFYVNVWYYYIATILSIILISKVGASIGQHRYFTHKSFKTSEFKEKIMAFFSVLSTTGSTIEYVHVHRYHHSNSDNGKDIHSPHEIGYWRSFWHWYVDDPKKISNTYLIRDLLKKKYLIQQHNYYFQIILLYIISLAVIDYNLILFCYVIPAGFSWWSSAVLSLPLHIPNHGYRNFSTGDKTVNSLLFNWLTLGEGLHNNHHAKPNEYNFAFTKKQWEWDLSAIIIEKIFK